MTEKRPVFLRKATGLVRAWTWWDAFWYNMTGPMAMTIGAATYLWCFMFVGQPILGLIFAGLLSCIMVVVYTILVTTIPRAGGDYTFLTRVLGGGVGWVATMGSALLSGGLWGSLNGIYISGIVMSPMLFMLSYVTKNPRLLEAAVWWNSLTGWIVGAILGNIWCVFLMIVGMRWYRKLQRWSFYIGTVCLVVVIGILLTSTHAQFVANFNNVMATTFNMPNAYDAIWSKAIEGGFKDMPVYGVSFADSWRQVPDSFLYLAPLMMFMMIYSMIASSLYGEIKDATSTRRVLGAGLLGIVYNVAISGILMALTYNLVGYEWYSAACYLYGMGDQFVPFFPYVTLFGACATNNPVLMVFVPMCFHFLLWMWLVNTWPLATRILLANAFDRGLPSWVGKVWGRTHAPVGATLLMIIATAVIFVLYWWVPGFSSVTLATGIGFYITTGLAGVACALLPYLKRTKEIYKASPTASWKLGGVPVATIAGIAWAVFMLYLIVLYSIDPRYGMTSPTSQAFIVAFYVGAIICYLIMKKIRARQGIDLGSTYAEIPYE